MEGGALHTAVGQKSIKTEWQMRKWKQSFRDCKLEKKEEAAMLRRQETAVGGLVAANCCCVCCSGPNQVDALANAVFQRFKESGAVQDADTRKR